MATNAEPIRAIERPTSLEGRSESALTRAAQGGSQDALAELFRRHWRGAHRAAYLVVHDTQAAEDIAQEAFISAIRSLGKFDRHRPFGPWLHRIAINRAIDWSRARRGRREVSEGSLSDHVTEVDFSGLADTDQVLGVLRELGPEQRAVLVLRYLLDYTPGEIAEFLSLPRGTVNSRLRRGLDAMAATLSRGTDD